jgi:colanic acid/amylovoran biosynthesis glycosyltransferase
LSQARSWKPAIIHAHFGTLGWSALRLKKALTAPLVTSFYGFDAWQLPTTDPEWRQRLSKLFARGHTFLVEGPAFRQRLIDLGCAPAKIRIQRLGVNLGQLQYRRRDFNGGLKIAMVGRFVEKKGLLDGLAACKKASASGLNLSVTIIGDAAIDAPGGAAIERDMLAVAQAPEMLDRVRFLGRMPYDETLRILASHDIFLCPSKHAASGDAEGGLPVVLIEAMALGLLCLGSRHCDIPEAIMDGKTGFLFEEGNIEELVGLLRRVSSTPERARSVTATGRKHIENTFDLTHQLSALSEIYQTIAACPVM